MSVRRKRGPAVTEEQLEAHRKRVEALEAWWVEFDEAVEHLFCTDVQAATVWQADNSIAWAGVDMPHYPREVPCNQPGVVCMQFGIPITKMAVDGNFMRNWMRIVRANGIHGTYRKAGTEKEYKF